MRLTDIFEMVRPRTDAVWATLDWAAQQDGEFTIKDLYREYCRVGGILEPGSFATTINKYIAKYDPNSETERYRDPQKYGVSDKRPIIRVAAGRRGAGNAASLSWGLDHPLREPPDPDQIAHGKADLASGLSGTGGDEIGDALDKLEIMVGREPLKDFIRQWKKMGDLSQIVQHIKKVIPARGRTDALHVAADALLARGQATPSDVKDAEGDVAGGMPLVKKPVQKHQPAPEPEPSPEDDFDFDDEFEAEPEQEPDPEPPPAAVAPTPPQEPEPPKKPPSAAMRGLSAIFGRTKKK